MIVFLQGLGDADTEYLEAGGSRGDVSRTEQYADSGDAGIFFLFRRLRRGSKSSRQARSIQRGFGFGADGPVWWLCRSQLLGRCVYPRCSNVPECHCSKCLFSFIFKHKLPLYCPVMSSHFLHPLGNYTLRAIFPEMCKINQSGVDLS